MAIAQVIKDGSSQLIQVPKDFEIKSHELEIFRRDDEIILREKKQNLTRAFEILCSLPDDFLLERKQEPPQSRDGF
jgi:antitoxin VapB